MITQKELVRVKPELWDVGLGAEPENSVGGQATNDNSQMIWARRVV